MFNLRSDKSLEQVWDNFFEERTRPLVQRFPGLYRGVVVETNDPLNFHRVRVKIPELYNNGVKREEVIWAIPAPFMGGRMAGFWTAISIGDIVFVDFEKQHPYGPVCVSAADATRRRSYPLWSVYTQPAPPVNQDGQALKAPDDHLEDYLPKDHRPMSTGLTDRYGHFLIFQSTGFFPKTHQTSPAPVGTDALAKRDFEASQDPPKANDPDVKYTAWGSKYGHYIIQGDQGYKWQEEFEGDFDSDIDFEVKRVKYFIRHFNEEKPNEWDQRRFEVRTRAGHKFEMRDVGWIKSREGEYSEDRLEIADSMGRDERWLKLRTKGGHLIQAIDTGFDPETDIRYNTINKSETGTKTDGEDELGANEGDDSRMIRIITRHGNQLILDDRGSDPRDAGEKKEPHGNGLILRSRKGYQMQFNDQPELDHMMMATPKDQVFEMNDKFQYVILTTTQSDDVHTEIESDPLTTKPRWILKTGQSNDPESNTHHLKLDKQNDYIRLRTPEGAGVEVRGGNAPCGSWVETRDQENRAVWMSKKDNLMLIRGKKGVKYILLDDNDDVILVRNEEGKIQIRARDKLEFKCDEGNICFEAPNGQIGMTSKSIEMLTNGTSHKIDGGGIGTSKTVQGQTLRGTHPELMPGPGGGSNAAKGGSPCKVDNKQLDRKQPEEFDNERGCDDQKEQKGPVPEGVVNQPPGGGTGGGNAPPGSPGGNPPLPLDDPRVQPPASSGNEPSQTVNDPPPPVIGPDPLTQINNGGVLWYGISSKFLDEIEELGLIISSFSNLENEPPNQDAERILLSRNLENARMQQAILAQQRYGEFQLILRIRNVPDVDLIEEVDESTIAYKGSIPFEGNIEIFEVGENQLTTPPLFPEIG